MASLGKIDFHGYHTTMEEVTLFNDGRNLQVRDPDHLLIEWDMMIFMLLMVLSMNVMVLMETYTYTL